MSKLSEKGQAFDNAVKALYPEYTRKEENTVNDSQESSPTLEIYHLTKTLIYLGKLLNKILRKEGETNEQLATEWYEELQEVEEDDSLTMIQKLQKSLDSLELILLGML